ncbi:7 transmembrane receptor (rhodopsin family) domain-containing protein [Ditylenchus destructor]|uniref:7 transmembrane receptor (Rhodopsin family) domain-containing protein n=1 Tax=Ditylenchus destructor TaxID=166010 RepID=A0AAD4N108_9BILA|nr:7 transmembrane receptor (rhodopsin family) domain-containing protein [Ditylenchus destructor]
MSNTTVVLPYSNLEPFTILPTMAEDAESPTLSPSSSASSSSSEDAPPEHLFSDYVEMAYLGVVILVGCCINLHILFKLIQEKKKNSNNKTMINLNISDLLILTVHAFGKLIWLAEYEWRFGEALCRSFNFLSMFTLYLSSNIVVCIALDRLRTVLRAKRITLLRKKRHLIRVFLVAAWMLAFIWSLPQLYFWKTYNVFPNYPGGWIQCTDIWSIERYERFLHSNRSMTQSVLLSDFIQNLYDLTHLFFVFYGPLIVLIICYLFISVRLMHFATTGGTQRVEAAVNPSMVGKALVNAY